MMLGVCVMIGVSAINAECHVAHQLKGMGFQRKTDAEGRHVGQTTDKKT